MGSRGPELVIPSLPCDDLFVKAVKISQIERPVDRQPAHVSRYMCAQTTICSSPRPSTREPLRRCQ